MFPLAQMKYFTQPPFDAILSSTIIYFNVAAKKPEGWSADEMKKLLPPPEVAEQYNEMCRIFSGFNKEAVKSNQIKFYVVTRRHFAGSLIIDICHAET